MQYWSASSLQLGDASSGEGCLRKWSYEKIQGLRPPQSRAQGVGVELHEQIEQYLKTGVNALGTLALRGKHMLPYPGDDLLVEHDLVIHPAVESIARDATLEGRHADAQAIRDGVVLSDAPLRLLGIPVLGFIDLAHTRGTNQGASDFEDAVDPPNTGEVLDHKTTKDVKYIKSPREVSKTVQMTLYEKWLLTVIPRLEHVRASHGYYITQGSHAPRKVSLRITRDQVEKQWEHVERVARSILDVLPETDISKVPANRNACGAYGGCPHRTYCTAGQESGLAKYFGTAGAARLQAQAKGLKVMNSEKKGGLLAFGKKNKVQEQIPAPTDLELQAEMKRLAKEEASAKYPTLLAEWEEFQAFGLGTPKLSGAFHQAIWDLTELDFQFGMGDFKDSGPFEDPEMMGALLLDIKAYVKEKEDTRPLPQIVPEEAEVAVEKAIAPITVVEAPAVVAETSAPTTAPKRRGRPPKVKFSDATIMSTSDAEQVAAIVAQVDALALTSTPSNAIDVSMSAELQFEKVEEILGAEILGAENIGVTSETPALVDPDFHGFASAFNNSQRNFEAREKAKAPLFFYVDAVPSCPSHNFWPTVNTTLSEMAKEAKLPDIRLADNKHDLGFGKWKYALHLCIQMNIPSSGHYTFDTTSTEISAVVVEALREGVLRAGGTFVRGTR